MNPNKSKADTFRFIARYGLLLLSFLLFLLALLSGAEECGGGFAGIVQNSPNAWPWLALILLVLFAWKNEFLGGVLITALGLYFVYYFNFSGPNFWFSTFLATLLIPVLGSFFLLSWYWRR
jgi:hypothetical protein